MVPKDFERQNGLGLPLISPKTESGQLEMWSKQRWPSLALKVVGHDIVKNGEELLAGKSNFDWALNINDMIWRHLGNVYYGEDAITARGAKLIGGLAVVGNWAMHDPRIAYLCLRELASLVKGNREREIMLKAALNYGQMVFPQAEQYMKTLDFLLEVRNRHKHEYAIKTLPGMLSIGNIEGAYNMVKSRGDWVRRQGFESSSTTTSSILTPPNPGI